MHAQAMARSPMSDRSFSGLTPLVGGRRINPTFRKVVYLIETPVRMGNALFQTGYLDLFPPSSLHCKEILFQFFREDRSVKASCWIRSAGSLTKS